MLNQRWRQRRDLYRPSGEAFAPHRYEVAALARDGEAKPFVVQHHYSASYPAARFRFGLFEAGELVGVAVFSVPCRDVVLRSAVPDVEVDAGVELGRFVLLDRVPGNGETWFLARAFEGLRREGLEAILSFSDPVPRRTADGSLIFPGHIGTIYQAHNAVYLGTGPRRSIRLLPDGTVFSARSISKVRAGERGWRYAARILERYGATDAPEDADERRIWLAVWLSRLTRTVRHSGNHRYVWSLNRAAQRQLQQRAQPYPKLQEAA